MLITKILNSWFITSIIEIVLFIIQYTCKLYNRYLDHFLKYNSSKGVLNQLKASKIWCVIPFVSPFKLGTYVSLRHVVRHCMLSRYSDCTPCIEHYAGQRLIEKYTVKSVPTFEKCAGKECAGHWKVRRQRVHRSSERALKKERRSLTEVKNYAGHGKVRRQISRLGYG